MTISRNQVSEIKKELDAFMIELAKKHGLSLAATKAKFSGETIYFDLTLMSQDENPISIGDTFKVDGLGIVTIKSYNKRAHKFPWIVEDKNGKYYKVPESDLVKI